MTKESVKPGVEMEPNTGATKRWDGRHDDTPFDKWVQWSYRDPIAIVVVVAAAATSASSVAFDYRRQRAKPGRPLLFGGTAVGLAPASIPTVFMKERRGVELKKKD